jgi:hypothetical protein
MAASVAIAARQVSNCPCRGWDPAGGVLPSGIRTAGAAALARDSRRVKPALDASAVSRISECLSGLLSGPPLAPGPAIGPPGQLLGADDIGVARLQRERLQPLAGRTALLADANLLHRETLLRGAGNESGPGQPAAGAVTLPPTRTL